VCRLGRVSSVGYGQKESNGHPYPAENDSRQSRSRMPQVDLFYKSAYLLQFTPLHVGSELVRRLEEMPQ